MQRCNAFGNSCSRMTEICDLSHNWYVAHTQTIVDNDGSSPTLLSATPFDSVHVVLLSQTYVLLCLYTAMQEVGLSTFSCINQLIDGLVQDFSISIANALEIL